MPTYEYKCDACGYEMEKFQSITAAPIKKCPKCGKNKLKRLIGTGAGMIFKGSGFYITDYRDKSYTDKAKADSGASSSTAPASSEGASKSDGAAAGAKNAETPKSTPAPKSESKSSKRESRKK